MRVLVDESLPRRLARLFAGHKVETVQSAGWAGIKNGELLRLALQAGFEAFVTGDQGLPYQQNLERSGLRTVILGGKSTRYADLEPLVPRALQALDVLKPGEVRLVR